MGFFSDFRCTPLPQSSAEDTLQQPLLWGLWRPSACCAACLAKGKYHTSPCLLQSQQKEYLISTTKNPFSRELPGTWAASVWSVVGRQKADAVFGYTERYVQRRVGASVFASLLPCPWKDNSDSKYASQFDPLVYGETEFRHLTSGKPKLTIQDFCGIVHKFVFATSHRGTFSSFQNEGNLQVTPERPFFYYIFRERN